MSDSTERFTTRVDDYAKYRPVYPREIVDAILSGLRAPVVADLGAGTGISSRLLADAGAIVYAVEPNAAMRRMLSGRDSLRVVNGTAEHTTITASSVDVVTAFQAYHWFEPDRVLAEARRITRAGGRFAAVWNHRERNDPFTGAYERIVDRYDESGGDIDRTRRQSTIIDDFRRNGWNSVQTIRCAHVQLLDWAALIGFSRSASYLPKDGPAYEAMEAELRALFERSAHPIAFAWVAQTYIAQRPLE